MGTAISKTDHSELLHLCRERKELIKAVIDCQYDLVSAHILYFQSMLEVGNALSQFVEEDLEITLDEYSEPSDENSHLKFPSESTDSESDLDSVIHCVHGNFDVLGENGDGEKLHGCDMSVSPADNISVIYKETIQGQYSPNMSSGVHISAPSRCSCYSQQAGEVYIPILDTRYLNRVPLISTMNDQQNNVKVSPYGNCASSTAPVDFFPSEFWFSYNNLHPEESASATAPYLSPPAPREPKVSRWDYHNPFHIEISNVYSEERKVNGGTKGDDPDLENVREKEGIPDLEEDTEQSSVEEGLSKETKLEGKMEDAGDQRKRTMEDSVPEAKTLEDLGDETKDDNYVEFAREKKIKSKLEIVEEHVEDMSNTSESQTLCHGSKSSGPTYILHCSKSLQQVLQEIQESFDTAFEHGKQVSILLEAGKPPYQPVSSKLKVFSTWILSSMVPSIALTSNSPTYVPLRKPASKTMKMAIAIGENNEKDVPKFSFLSSTLWKMHIWEKKLYKEVKVEEKLRIIYEKKCKKIRCLDDRGAEVSKIDNAHSSIKMLLPKINVAVTAVHAVSTMIHRLRDEDLQSQLTELIEGLSKMWKAVLECHQKQFQAVADVKTCATVNVRGDSSLEATLKLEKVTLNWATHFTDYIRTQKAFARLLNDWLRRHISYEPEETPDGIVPYSPGRIGAPPVFIIGNDWCHTICNVSEDGVYDAICGFASSLHQLLEKRDKEQCHRIKSVTLLKDFTEQLKLQEKNGIHLHQDPSECSESGVPLMVQLNAELVSARKRLDEQKERHEEALKLMNDAALNCFTIKLPSVFAALQNFCLENLTAYERIRIQNESTNQ